MSETIDAEIRPAKWTLSSGGVFLIVLLVALFSLLLGSVPSGLSAGHLLGLGIVLMGIGLFIHLYQSAREPVSTEAWFEENRLVVRDPNSWWKRLSDPYFGWKLRLEVEAVEWDVEGPIVTGYATEATSWGRKFRIRLWPDEEQAKALKTRLAESRQ